MPVKILRVITKRRAGVYNIQMSWGKKLREFEEKVEKYWFFKKNLRKKASKEGKIIENSG